MAKMSQVQLIRAHRLAGAFGHLWASLLSVTECVRGGGDPARIAEETRRLDAGRSAGYGGILAPDLDGDSNVVHTTCSGRTSWTIRPDGSVRIERCHALDGALPWAIVEIPAPGSSAGVRIMRGPGEGPGPETFWDSYGEWFGTIGSAIAAALGRPGTAPDWEEAAIEAIAPRPVRRPLRSPGRPAPMLGG